MKKVLVIGVLAAAVALTASCDMFRRMAGRPTSADIAEKSELIQKAEAAEQARLEAIELAKKRQADSLAVLDSMLHCGTPIKTTKQISPSAKAKMTHRYFIVVGAFGDHHNAERMQKKAADAGFDSELITYRNGVTAVGLCPSNDLVSLYEPLKAVKQQPFCPKEVWILDNE